MGNKLIYLWVDKKKMTKNNFSAYWTWYSQLVSHASTNHARHSLTSVIGREKVQSTWYGRRHRTKFCRWLYYVRSRGALKWRSCGVFSWISSLNLLIESYVYGIVCPSPMPIMYRSCDKSPSNGNSVYEWTRRSLTFDCARIVHCAYIMTQSAEYLSEFLLNVLVNYDDCI